MRKEPRTWGPCYQSVNRRLLHHVGRIFSNQIPWWMRALCPVSSRPMAFEFVITDRFFVYTRNHFWLRHACEYPIWKLNCFITRGAIKFWKIFPTRTLFINTNVRHKSLTDKPLGTTRWNW